MAKIYNATVSQLASNTPNLSANKPNTNDIGIKNKRFSADMTDIEPARIFDGNPSCRLCVIMIFTA